MPDTIVIRSGDISVTARLLDTPTAAAIRKALPVTGTANTWGEEIYFEIPVTLPRENDARMDVKIGDLGYWPVGRAFCAFFGSTPLSSGPEPKAASAVNVFGRISGDPTVLRNIRDGDAVTVDVARKKTKK